MTLEEHEPNPEFIGRNFNAGEIIQLVLKAPYTGHWLSFRSVQLVMMHELAHCVQMNHSGAFWKVNNQFKEELRELWERNYTGDGLWGRGQTLLSGEYHKGVSMENEVLPANLCGGTFRSSRRGKRKRGGEKSKETYAERQQRRIKKKFGVNGHALGDDVDTRVKLEKGKQPKGKPRVAGSARGRELRAAAALVRFEQVKNEDPKLEEESLFGDSETESNEGAEDEEAVEPDGSRILDAKGRGMVKICEGEAQDDPNVNREIEELREWEGSGQENCLGHTGRASRLFLDTERISRAPRDTRQTARHPSDNPSTAAPVDDHNIRLHDIPLYVEKEATTNNNETSSKRGPQTTRPLNHGNVRSPQPPSADDATAAKTGPRDDEDVATGEHGQDHTGGTRPTQRTSQAQSFNCSICSMENEASSLLCIACSHVLDTNRVTRYWRCGSEACKTSQYINAADCGLCGICGSRRSETK